MAAHGPRQAAARARRPAVSAGIPIPAAKITAPGVPDWALTRPRITKLIAQGTRWCPLTVLTAPAGAGKTIAPALCARPNPGRWPGSVWIFGGSARLRAGRLRGGGQGRPP
jgi:hypothetical protein